MISPPSFPYSYPSEQLPKDLIKIINPLLCHLHSYKFITTKIALKLLPSTFTLTQIYDYFYFLKSHYSFVLLIPYPETKQKELILFDISISTSQPLYQIRTIKK